MPNDGFVTRALNLIEKQQPGMVEQMKGMAAIQIEFTPLPQTAKTQLTTALDGYENMAGMWIVGEDMPQETNRITLNMDVKDQHGLPVVNVHFDDHPNDIAMRNHAYEQGAAIYDAVGATRTFPTPPYPSTHNLGTNRMSENARDGVVNKWGRTHYIPMLYVSDGSVFTTGAAENPTLTIVALAIRQADHLASEMSKGNL